MEELSSTQPRTLSQIFGDSPYFSFQELPWNEVIELDNDFLRTRQVNSQAFLRATNDFVKVHGGKIDTWTMLGVTSYDIMRFKIIGAKPASFIEQKPVQKAKTVEICMLDIIEKEIPEGERNPENILKLICSVLYPNHKTE